ncbi:PadR family transcriptional regulator [Leifsonia poae]|uniref:PadR family transcriptional regulator n=1 Tax=Leifsonia poae TaxID=110933 RepID=UPI001CC07B80|nr:PadR family transcriptional regulator [Leifsonia poae]
MSKRPVSNPLALAVLSCLWERPMYPYEMTTSMRERGKEDSIRLNFGSLYSVIKTLEKHGLIVVAQTEREGNRPERIVYAITEAGRREAHEWLRELIDTPAKEYPAIETGLSLITMLPPDEALELLEKRAERLGADIAARELSLTGEAAAVPELFMVEFHLRLAMLRAERDYIAGLAERIREREVGGIEMWEGLHELLAQGLSMVEIQRMIEAGDFGQEVADLFSS